MIDYLSINYAHFILNAPDSQKKMCWANF